MSIHSSSLTHRRANLRRLEPIAAPGLWGQLGAGRSGNRHGTSSIRPINRHTRFFRRKATEGSIAGKRSLLRGVAGEHAGRTGRSEEAVIALRPRSSCSIARQVSRAHRAVLSAGRVGTTSPILYQSDIWAQRGRAWLLPQITSGCLVGKRATRCALRDSERPSARTTDTGGWQLTTGKLMVPTSGRWTSQPEGVGMYPFPDFGVGC